MNPEKSMVRRRGWLLLILLAAVFLRLYDVTGTPPGLTHDEADHGVTAHQVINGERAVYFTVGYGREPLFDYSTALLMSFIGPTYLASRLNAIFFSLILIAFTYAWVRRAFDETTALFTVAGLALGFWAVMTARQSLRSESLPALFVPALYFFWCGLYVGRRPRPTISLLLLAGILLGLTFYTYIPSRILWLLFPLAAVYVGRSDKALAHRAWRATALVLLIAALVGSPLFTYLLTNPEAEARIGQLSSPLAAAVRGDLEPLTTNALKSLGIITFSGDPFWRYNIPGRPFLQPLMGALFYLGLAVATWHMFSGASHRQRPAYAATLGWLLLGIAPVLVTGPELSTTQAIGMQPVLYLFPALGMKALGKLRIGVQKPFAHGRLATLPLIMLFAGTGIDSGIDYFAVWARAPEVRVQYETTMVTAVRYLGKVEADAAAVSTITPNRFHTPAIAQLLLPDKSANIRWFDGRHSLSLPLDRQVIVLLPGFAPLAPELAGYFESAVLTDVIPQPATDLDQPLKAYRLDGISLAAAWQRQFGAALDDLEIPVSFGGAAEFLGFELGTPAASPGETVPIATLWRVLRPLEDALLFTHVQGVDGTPLAQEDRLDVPGNSWHTGDLFIQLHLLEIAADTPAGDYPVVVGLCQGSSADCSRLPIMRQGSSSDVLRLTTLSIMP
jgi:hypothetical protein